MSERPAKRKLSKRQFCKDHVFIYQGESEYIRIAVDDRCLDARLRHPRLDRGSHNDEIAGQAGNDERDARSGSGMTGKFFDILERKDLRIFLETLYNPNFNPLEFEGIRKEAGFL